MILFPQPSRAPASQCPHCLREFTNLRHHINQQHMQVNQSLSPQHWGVTNPSHINQLLVTPPLLTFYVGKISACLTCSPCCTSRKIKCLDAKYGTKAFLLVNLEVQSRGWGGRGGSALAEVQSGQEWLHCWTQTILLTECCNMVVKSGSPTGTNEGWGTSITTKNVVLTLESMFEEGILSVSATKHWNDYFTFTK